MKTDKMNRAVAAPDGSNLGCAVRSALCDFAPDWRVHEIRREIWRGLLRRLERVRVTTR
jgi:hypothetical protein